MTQRQAVQFLIVMLLLAEIEAAFPSPADGLHQPINIVLIAVGSDPPLKSSADGDWKKWEEESPKLLFSIEKEAGFVRGNALHPTPEANLFAFESAARDLGDRQTPTLLQERLGEIFKATHRVGLLVVWQKPAAAVVLAIHDGTVESLQRSLPLLQCSLDDPVGRTTFRQSGLPPCIFSSKVDISQRTSSKERLDALVGGSKREELLHLLAVQAFQTRQETAGTPTKKDLMPAGATMDLETLQQHVGQLNEAINLFYNVAGKDMHLSVAVPLSFVANMAVPIAQDSEAARNGQYNILTSKGMEAFGKFMIDILPTTVNTYAAKWNLPQNYGDKLALPLAGLPDFVSGISSQVGRGNWQPNITEITHYVDGAFNYTMAAAGGVIGGEVGIGPVRGAQIAMAGGNILKDFGQQITLKPMESLALDSIKGPMLDQLKTELQADLAHNIPINNNLAATHPEMWSALNPAGQIQAKNMVSSYSDVQNLAKIVSLAVVMNQNPAANVKTFVPPEPTQMRISQTPAPYVPDSTKYYPPITQMPFGGGGPGGGGALSGGSGGGPSGGAGRLPSSYAPPLSSPTINALKQFSLNSPYPSYLSQPAMQMTMPQMSVIRPGGILLAPELEIVADTTGLTASRAQQAIVAVKGKDGGEFTTPNGEHFIAVRQPGTAKLFQVKAGRFHFMETDLEIAAEKGGSLRLVRFYDSGETNASVLGRGWSLLPYSLRIGSMMQFGQDGTEFAAKPILVDRERGVEVSYRLITSEDSASSSTSSERFPSYIAAEPGIQPFLTGTAEGGYEMTFAHGFRISFSKNGRLQWMGYDEKDGVHYDFHGDNLVRLFSGTSDIRLIYDESLHLTAAVTGGGKTIAYQIGNDARLDVVVFADSERQSFSYASDGRLKTVQMVTADGRNQTIVDNDYDNFGRMLIHKTPDASWSAKYDDVIGCDMVTDETGNSTTHYYDGNSRMIASGTSHKSMRLFNYDIYGRVIQVAEGELLNDPSTGERPRFRVTKLLFDSTQPVMTAAQKG